MSKSKEEKNRVAANAAASETDVSTNVYEGNLVSVYHNKIMVRNKEGNEHSHILAKDVLLTCDGALCTVETLKGGNRVRVTTEKNNRNISIRVDSLDKNPEFAPQES